MNFMLGNLIDVKGQLNLTAVIFINESEALSALFFGLQYPRFFSVKLI